MLSFNEHKEKCTFPQPHWLKQDSTCVIKRRVCVDQVPMAFNNFWLKKVDGRSITDINFTEDLEQAAGDKLVHIYIVCDLDKAKATATITIGDNECDSIFLIMDVRDTNKY